MLGGELFSQRLSENTISLNVTSKGLELSILSSTREQNSIIDAHLLDNRWHTVNLQYHLGNLTLSIDGYSKVMIINDKKI